MRGEQVVPSLTILDRYQLQRKIGEGGMAQAWLALQMGAEGFLRPVVVKMLQSGTNRKHLIQEGRILSGLNHPNLVQVVELLQDDNQLFLVLEWINGLDLATFLLGYIPHLKKESVSVQEWFAILIYVAQEVLEALAYCHCRKPQVVHGDVTPQNILINRQGQIKLTDFGIATLLKSEDETYSPVQSQTATLWGKPHYCAPEVLKGGAAYARLGYLSSGKNFGRGLFRTHSSGPFQCQGNQRLMSDL